MNSKERGKGFEREVVRLFREYGFDAHRTAQYMGKTGQAGDVEGVDYIHIEAKKRKSIAVYEWMEQAIRDTTAEGKGNLPTVVMRADYRDALVLMRFEDWIKLYKEFEVNRALDKKEGLLNEM